MNAVLVAEVTRGPVVESRHVGHAVVVDPDGRIVAAWGDPRRPTLPRSAVKPIQALPAIAGGAVERFSLTPAEVAVMCASHAAEPFHLAAVRSILGKIGAAETDLHCGQHAPGDPSEAAALLRRGEQPTAIHNNCSGKHAGMLTLARLLDAPFAGYWEPDHPVQRAIQRALALTSTLQSPICNRGTHVSGSSPIPTWGTDGCGVPTYELTLQQLATGFARLANPEGLPDPERRGATAILTAVNECPEMVSGTHGFCTALLRAGRGQLLAKGGAEGCYAVGIRAPRLGLALKIEDGSPRAVSAVVTTFLRRLEALDEEQLAELAPFHHPVLRNTRQAEVGAIRCVLGEG